MWMDELLEKLKQTDEFTLFEFLLDRTYLDTVKLVEILYTSGYIDEYYNELVEFVKEQEITEEDQ